MPDKNEYRALLAEVQNVVADVTNTAINDRINLRDAVCAYLAAEKRKGALIATVLQSVEAILKRAEARVPEMTSNGHRELAQKLIDWCVELDQRGHLRIV